MEMWLPGGSGLIDALVDTSPTPSTSGHGVVKAPTAADLDEQLARLRRGHIEYVILAREDGWYQQTSGSGDGPYWLERRPRSDDQPFLEAVDPLDFDLLRQAMHAFLAGADEPAGLGWKQTVPPPPRKGLLRRLLGR